MNATLNNIQNEYVSSVSNEFEMICVIKKKYFEVFSDKKTKPSQKRILKNNNHSTDPKQTTKQKQENCVKFNLISTYPTMFTRCTEKMGNEFHVGCIL